MAITWTTEQQNVIDFRNRDILVSAAAGSGKTAVLVERIVQRITDKENPIDIDRLLVVTFTKAAAAEMRERIADAIERKREEFPEDRNLLRQSSLIHNALITTIDSFCLFVVRNHFEEINLEPNFRIADEGEMKLLELDVLNALFEENYQKQNNEMFLRLVDCYSGKRSDQAVKEMVEKIYRMSLSSPWPNDWVEQLAHVYQIESEEELACSVMMREIAVYVQKILKDIKVQLEHLMQISLQPDGPLKYATTLEQDLEQFIIEELDDYPKLLKFFGQLKLGSLAQIRNFEGDPLKKETVQSQRNQIKKELEELRKKYFSIETEELLKQLKRLRPIAEELVRLCLSYQEKMAEKKRQKRIVDFSDIEHFALRILVDEKTKEPRETAGVFRNHFEEIMIDEYQDSNQVQEEIMCAISKRSDGIYNMFMVGDVKQSIYRFRLARPELFMEKYAQFDIEESLQQRIDLHQNFRSRKEVLDFCNDIFYKIMHRDLGNVDYDDNAALYHGAVYPMNAHMETEVLLLDEKDELLDDQQEIGKKRLEASMVATRIKRLMKESYVTDKESKELRPVRYSDIVILFRSIKDWGREFVSVLEEYGIPVHVDSSTGYFSAIEVQTVLNMLRILDNPYQDIPMAAVLKSPMAGLDEEELAQIRISDTGIPFAAAALQQMKESTADTPLYHFYEIYQKLRAEKDVPIHELIVHILDWTGYGNYAAALPAGEQRAANLSMLIEKAIAYEKTSYKGLFHFVRYIDQLEKYEIDFGEASIFGENANVVHIMTIHKSKGLEFPIVFVSGLSKRFNQMDTNDKLVIHPDLGMGIYEIEKSPKIKRQCLLRTEIADHIRRENLGEELRILYVALTRAKEKLILTGLVNDYEKTISKYTANVTPKQPLSYMQRVKALSYLDWIIPAVLSYPDKYALHLLSPEMLVWDEIIKKEQDIGDYQFLLDEIKKISIEKVEEVAKEFAYQYPYQQEVGKKSKYSVSELKHDSMWRQYDMQETEAMIPQFLLEEKVAYIPEFAYKNLQEETKEQTPNRGALRGTAVHRVMECLDFSAMETINITDDWAVSQFVESELTRMVQNDELTEDFKSLIQPKQIEEFVKSDVAIRMARAAKQGELYREKPFVMEHEGVLVQGIIDVFWIEANKIIVLDYKTDRVEVAEELVNRYETQLKLYADALARVFSNEKQKIEAKECLIYSFRLQEVVIL